MQRIFVKKYFLFTVGSFCRVMRFTAESKNSLKDVLKLQMMPDQITLLRLWQKQTVQRVEELIRADRRITTDSVATALGSSCGLAYSIMHDRLKFRKVCARWVPRELKHQDKLNRIGLSLQHLLWYSDEVEDTSMLNRIVTGGITTDPIQSVFHCYGNIPVHLPFQRKSLRLRVSHQLGRLCLMCVQIIRKYC
jgi:hypothetical protein